MEKTADCGTSCFASPIVTIRVKKHQGEWVKGGGVRCVCGGGKKMHK
jgi:hypothetical protein